MTVIRGMENKRLYVGNLWDGVEDEDLKKKFSKFGTVSKIEIKQKKDIDGNVTQAFAFIDLSVDSGNLIKCISALNNKNWKGHQMTVQQAKESFMDRLARERKINAAMDGDSKPEKRKPNELTTERFKKLKTGESEDDEKEFEGFSLKTKVGPRYDPLRMLKSKVSGEDTSELFAHSLSHMDKDVDVGVVENGIVNFNDDEDGNSLALKKNYHSSSDDDQAQNTNIINREKKTVKKKLENDLNHKKKMTERFLQRKEEKPKIKLESSNEQKSSIKSNKFYEGSSDEEDEANTDRSIGDGDVLQNIQSFSSIWKDTTDNKANPISPYEDSSESDSEGSSSDESEESIKASGSDDYDNKNTEVRSMSSSSTSFQKMNIVMPRYDPTSDDHAQFLKKTEHLLTEEKKEVVAAPKTKSSSKFEVKMDLKQVFGSKENSTGFSFGFGSGEQEKNSDPSTFHLDTKVGIEEDTGHDKEKVNNLLGNNSAFKFGMQLKGKGVENKIKSSFFFTEDDPRLEEGISYFFDTKLDLDVIREKFNKQRPILSEILKKRQRSKLKRLTKTSKKRTSSWNKGNKKKFKKINNSKTAT